jgi:hypothetical protein
MIAIDDTFRNNLDSAWVVTEVGGGSVRAAGGLHLAIRPSERGGERLSERPSVGRYHNAQITDYVYGSATTLRWRPPVRMTVRASAALTPENGVGTAGFGFWNHPFSPDSARVRLPRAIWFFYAAPPNDMRLALDVPGHGWKAAVIDATTPRAWALAPFAPPAVLLMRVPALYRRLYPVIQRRLAIAEALLDPALLTTLHDYVIDWRRDGASFSVDGRVVLETPHAPRGACGFVAWIDCQYAIVTPQGRIGFGVVPLRGEQRMFIDSIRIDS